MTKIDNNTVSVVGIHVASHNDPQIQKKRKLIGSTDLEGSVLSSVHGHTAYSLVCEVARVPDLVNLLNST